MIDCLFIVFIIIKGFFVSLVGSVFDFVFFEVWVIFGEFSVKYSYFDIRFCKK